jgi:3-dehydroquinate synthase
MTERAVNRSVVIPPDVHVVRDNIPLDDQTQPIQARACRVDSYSIVVVRSAGAAVDRIASFLPRGSRVAIVTDETVRRRYGAAVCAALRSRGHDVIVAAMRPGEASKGVDTAVALLNWLAESEIGRRDMLLAVGGGVVIDTAGWVASAYMRGLPYVNVPTTLLAQVDAAIGGKVAVDHRLAKNLIGAFYHPTAVVSNIGYLGSLSARQLRAGLAEAIKKGVIASADLFDFIECDLHLILAGDSGVLYRLVRHATAVKCRLVGRDPYEHDLRRPLNFGHTIGHAIETVTAYGPVLHGEAVAVGMAAATRISHARGWTEHALHTRLLGLLRRAGLPVTLADLQAPVDAEEVIGALAKIRLIRDGRLRFVLPVRLGEAAIVDDVTDAEIRQALDASVPVAAAP